ncbi:protein DpdE [Streptomyces sp. CB03911]|uniref:protein DpdE n=1 Tax=Streptomyces sp. CB03911 TaxID=1804758 RepID=UPI00256FA89A|nr:protein DpdE [Streptomyces sp. CB03911]
MSVPGGAGIGSIGAVDGDRLRIDYFESAARPVAESCWVQAAECRAVTLEREDRVWWRRPDDDAWSSVRIVGADVPGESYFVRFADLALDASVPVRDLHIRWDGPGQTPVPSIAVRGGVSSPYRDARLPMLESFVAQRSACAGLTALLSSAVEFYPHQVDAAVTILTDPVQRYLLADEVGLGKTIEAGVVVRQALIDNPRAKVVVIAPEALRTQWRRELRAKFFTDDFPNATIIISSHGTSEKWAGYHGSDLVVVDEAHDLVQVEGPEESPYRELAALTASSDRLLLLSATPVTSRHLTNLGLLHLLDPDLYRWDQREEFEQRYRNRAELARAVYALDADFIYSIRGAVDEVAALIPPEDARFRELADVMLELLDEEDELRDPETEAEFAYRVRQVREHISETYRLHRRVIRNRRASVVVDDSDAETESYVVRGRQRPQQLVGASEPLLVGPEVLNAWRVSVVDALVDADQEERVADYGMALAVLASRATATPDDLLDALRWRLNHDAAAADRAGLTAYERRCLAEPQVQAGEKAALDDGVASARSSGSAAAAVIPAVTGVLRNKRRAIIFCGPGRLATDLATAMNKRFGAKALIAVHTRGMTPAAAEGAVEGWQHAPGQAVLIVDDSAEDGLNLQVADSVIHLRLPWSPNQLEQRMGRVDRYRGVESIRLSEPADQYRLAADEVADSGITDAWAALLDEGYDVFTASVSTLQDAIAESVLGIWTAAMTQGPEGLIGAVESVKDRLGDAREAVEQMDGLESIHRSTSGLRNIPDELSHLEGQWRILQGQMRAYTAQGSGGIGLPSVERRVGAALCEVFPVNSGGSAALLPRRRWSALTEAVPADEVATGVFNRSVALRVPHTRIFRLGNPFVDSLMDIVLNDDLGQAAAISRLDRHFHGEPHPFFGFDYLVEADAGEALKLVGDSPLAAKALRRQADRVLAPFMYRVWVEAGTWRVVTEPLQLEWLNRPYDKMQGDRNYNHQRVAELFDIFGGADACGESAVEAEGFARQYLVEATELTEKCQETRDLALQEAAVLSAQAEARRAAGRLVGDVEGLVTDAHVVRALADGLAEPSIRVVAAVCVVRRGMVRVAK